jgi:hypothetical protein
MGSHHLLPEASAGLYRDMMSRFLGPVIMRAFDDPDVTEVYTNPHDQRIWLITHSAGRVNTGESIAASSVLSFLNTVATSLRTAIGADHPDLQAELPLGSHRNPRLQGLIPPIVEGPCFVIRKHAPEVYSIDRLVDDESSATSSRTSCGSRLRSTGMSLSRFRGQLSFGCNSLPSAGEVEAIAPNARRPLRTVRAPLTRSHAAAAPRSAGQKRFSNAAGER